MSTRRTFLKAAALAPVAAAAPGALVDAAAQAPQAANGAAEAPAAARAMFEAMKAAIGRPYTPDEEARIMRKLEAAERQHAAMNEAGLKNWDEPVTVFFAERELPAAGPRPKGAR